MRTSIEFPTEKISIDLSKPLDISLPLRGNEKNPVAWYLDAPKIEPVKDDNWIAKVSEGASVNFNNIFFNPHAHTTHTECVGHISEAFYSIHNTLNRYFFKAKVISLSPERLNGDEVLTKKQLEKIVFKNETEALIIRTLPNSETKKSRKYSYSNWPYLLEEAAEYIRECGILHLLIDVPSVDKEKDNGKLLAHRAFWNYPKNTRFAASITELIFVPDEISDGNYVLNLQVANFENDAAPSRPILYSIEN
ncbi:MAG TPA: cyclase family protein [Flavobacteriaceae bacterium]|nr:cyclase family protein [Flavobacteriaceae bacterium]